MEKAKTAKWSRFSIFVLCGLGCATILSIFISFNFEPLFVLNENQLLYLFSSMAQIIGSVFGLTLTAYVFFEDKFKESAQDDDSYYDATIAWLERYFYSLVLIAVACGLTILSCIFGIISLHNLSTVYPFIINESVFLFILSIISIFLFGVTLLAPEKLEREMAKLKKQAEEFFKEKVSKQEGDFRDFLKSYNLMQEVIINLANCFIDDKVVSSQTNRNYRPQIIQSLKILNGCQVIGGNLVNEINELRMFRNSLVHGVDLTVSQGVCDRAMEIYVAINGVYKVYKKEGIHSKQWEEVIKKVYDLTK